jgi:hypothetical protein
MNVTTESLALQGGEEFRLMRTRPRHSRYKRKDINPEKLISSYRPFPNSRA